MKMKPAFAKTDLLVLILGVLFLLANLGAIGAGGRQRAKDALCLSNLRQWGVVFSMYAQDNNGKTWDWKYGWYSDAHKKYYVSEKLLFCPTATKSFADCGGLGTIAAWGPPAGPQGSYGANFWTNSSSEGASGFNPGWAWSNINMKGVENAPFLGDCALDGSLPTILDTPPPFDGFFYSSGSGGSLHEIRRFCVNRHNAAMNMLFVDFSARKAGLKGLWEIKWHQQWQNLITGGMWPAWMKNFKDY